jgi:tripartite motif-containing protein 71
VADTGNHRLVKLFPGGGLPVAWGSGLGANADQFSSPQGVVVDSAGFVYVADWGNNRVVKWNPDGTPVADWPGSSHSFAGLQGIAVDDAGHLFLALIVPDASGHHIARLSTSGELLPSWGDTGDPDVALCTRSQMYRVRGVAVDEDGYVYVVDSWHHRIQKFTSDGVFVTCWGSQGDGPGEFLYPFGVGVDEVGHVFVADTNNHRIEMFSNTGVYLTEWGEKGTADGQFKWPPMVAANASGSEVYVADMANHRVQAFRF